MLNLALIPTVVRELLVKQALPRQPEPDLIMDDAEQVAAYVEAGRVDGIMAAAYLFHSARVSQVIQGCESVLDLGCGPATQLAQIAQLNSGVRFTGVDLSATMLADARRHIETLELDHVNFREGDITSLAEIPDHSVDAVISTMALHHLPTVQDLRNCFRNVARVLRPGGALYLTDFGRLKSEKSIQFFVQANAAEQPRLFSLDYERSLRAAFLRDDFERAAREHLPPNVELFSTFKIPVLVMLKTADKPLPESLRQRIQAMYAALPPRYRRDLDTMRTFFRLGSLKNDPFG